MAAGGARRVVASIPDSMARDTALQTIPSASSGAIRRIDRAASWVGRHGDAVVFRLLRGLFSKRGVAPMTPEELERSFALLRCYTDPAVLQDPDRLFAPPRAVPEVDTRWRRPVRGGLHSHYTFASPYRPVHPIYAAEFRRYDKLDTVHLFAWQHARPAPASILVTHGWGVGHVRLHELEFGLKYLFRDLGLDVYYYVHPFHWVRRPSSSRLSGELHPSPNLMRTNEAFIQTVQEIRTALGWILAQRDVPIGMMGSSLGGYTTALIASLDPRMSFAIPVLPPASLADLFWEQGESDPLRAHAESIGMTQARFSRAWALHSPLSYQPRIPHEARLIVTANGDGLVTEKHTAPLWEHWGRCRRFHFSGGHILQVGRKAYHREVGDFLATLGLTRSG